MSQSLEVIWAKDFEVPEGGRVELGEFWVDPSKNRVIFKLYHEKTPTRPTYTDTLVYREGR